MRRLHVLTFNWHEAYLTLLAKTQHEFTVIDKFKGGLPGWLHQTRPVPDNITLLPIGSEEAALARARSGAFDVVLCHNLGDLASLAGVRAPKIVVFHNCLSTEVELFRGAGQPAPTREKYAAQFRSLFDERTHAVFISERKRADARPLTGRVIPPGIDLDDYHGYRGDLQRVLRVGNFFTGRDLMLGQTLAARATAELPVTVVGVNPEIAGAHLSGSWDELKESFRAHRVYLNTTLEPREDGYNLAMLEAMATGMPVVSCANATSPLDDGIDGFVAGDDTGLRERLLELLADRELGARLGARGREKVADRFPIGRFVEAWNSCFEAALSAPSRTRVRIDELTDAAPRTERRRIVLAYCGNPQTTAAYLERALRARHDVRTWGPSIDAEVVRAWDLAAIRDRIVPTDLGYDSPDIAAALERSAPGWTPDLFLWVETGVSFPITGMERLACPAACYLIDTHLEEPGHRRLDSHIEWARRFDRVFLAQRAYVGFFRARGIDAHWLPLACDPEIHGEQGFERIHPVGFVGSLNHERRVALLKRLGARIPVHVERAFLETMARVFSQSRIVFNNAVNRDLNMRVFEALASGALLLTDPAAGSGLEEMFRDGEHCAIYRSDDSVVEVAARWLADDERRQRVARGGQAEVLRRHTYAHRVALVEQVVFGRSDEEPDLARELVSVSDDLRARARALMSSGKRSPAEAVLARGRILLASGRWDEAWTLLRDWKGHGAVPVYRDLGLGCLALARADWQEAEIRFRAVLEAAPDDERARGGLGLALAYSGRAVDAAEVMTPVSAPA